MLLFVVPRLWKGITPLRHRPWSTVMLDTCYSHGARVYVRLLNSWYATVDRVVFFGAIITIEILLELSVYLTAVYANAFRLRIENRHTHHRGIPSGGTGAISYANSSARTVNERAIIYLKLGIATTPLRHPSWYHSTTVLPTLCQSSKMRRVYATQRACHWESGRVNLNAVFETRSIRYAQTTYHRDFTHLATSTPINHYDIILSWSVFCKNIATLLWKNHNDLLTIATLDTIPHQNAHSFQTHTKLPHRVSE